MTLTTAAALAPATARAAATVESTARLSPPAGYPANPSYHGTQAAACPAATDSRVVDLTIYTTSLSINATDYVDVRVILPVGWSANSTKTWPVLYVLPGLGETFEAWSCNSFIEQYVGNAGVIVVMPDGSREFNPPQFGGISGTYIPGLYANWSSPSSDGSPEQWETFHLTELPAIVKSTFHANSTWAVAGLSMGGLGALTYAGRHPGMFVAAAAYSGTIHTESSEGEAVEQAGLLGAGQNPNAPWGYLPGTTGALLFGSQWAAYDPTALAKNFLHIPLFISSGNGMPGTMSNEEDSASTEAAEVGTDSMGHDFVNAVIAANGGTAPAGLVTDFYGNGVHAWDYWDAELCRSMPMLMSALGVPYVAPVQCTTP
jgi:S-formylglutathione hydrolase FrmB